MVNKPIKNPQTKNEPKTPGTKIERVELSIFHPMGDGHRSGKQYPAHTTGEYSTVSSRKDSKKIDLPPETEWIFEAKINGIVTPMEFEFVSYSPAPVAWRDCTFNFRFTPEKEGEYEIVAIAIYDGANLTSSKPAKFTVLPPK